MGRISLYSLAFYMRSFYEGNWSSASVAEGYMRVLGDGFIEIIKRVKSFGGEIWISCFRLHTNIVGLLCYNIVVTSRSNKI